MPSTEAEGAKAPANEPDAVNHVKETSNGFCIFEIVFQRVPG